MRLPGTLLLAFAATLLPLPLAGAQAVPGSAGSADSPAAPTQTTPNPRVDSKPAPAQTSPNLRTDSKPSATQTSPDLRTDAKPAPVERSPDLRTDSKPIGEGAADADSKPYNLLGGPPEPKDLGFDPNTYPPAGMVATAQPGNPLLLFLALPSRPTAAMSPADAALIAMRQSDISQAAALHGYDLKQDGWQTSQVLCPATGADAPGALTLRYVRQQPGGEQSVFTAVVPAAPGKVRVIAVLHRSTTPFHAALHGAQNIHAASEALPPAMLKLELEPDAEWLAASACIAELAGADPHIPNDPDLDREHRITAAPSPLLRLLIDGDRKVYFTDVETPDRYSVWDEWVEHTGAIRQASHQGFDSPVLPVTNPPETPAQPVVVPPQPSQVATIVPPEPPSFQQNPPETQPQPATQPPEPSRVTLTPPDPPHVLLPTPPDPLSGEHQ